MTSPAAIPADLATIVALFHCTDPEARDEALRLADENCKASGHRPRPTGADTERTKMEKTYDTENHARR